MIHFHSRIQQLEIYICLLNCLYYTVLYTVHALIQSLSRLKDLLRRRRFRRHPRPLNVRAPNTLLFTVRVFTFCLRVRVACPSIVLTISILYKNIFWCTILLFFILVQKTLLEYNTFVNININILYSFSDGSVLRRLWEAHASARYGAHVRLVLRCAAERCLDGTHHSGGGPCATPTASPAASDSTRSSTLCSPPLSSRAGAGVAAIYESAVGARRRRRSPGGARAALFASLVQCASATGATPTSAAEASCGLRRSAQRATRTASIAAHSTGRCCIGIANGRRASRACEHDFHCGAAGPVDGTRTCAGSEPARGTSTRTNLGDSPGL